MFCPRCGRPVSDAANFCGGCGLPKTEILRLIQEKEKKEALNTPVQETPENLITHGMPVQPDEDIGNITPVISQDSLPVQPQDAMQEDVQSQAEYAGAQTYQNPSINDYTTQNNNAPQKFNTDQNLSTVDFIWMMILSCLPFIGLFYAIYLAFIQDKNINKRSYGRAFLLIGLFSFLIGFVFLFGFISSQLFFY